MTNCRSTVGIFPVFGASDAYQSYMDLLLGVLGCVPPPVALIDSSALGWVKKQEICSGLPFKMAHNSHKSSSWNLNNRSNKLRSAIIGKMRSCSIKALVDARRCWYLTQWDLNYLWDSQVLVELLVSCMWNVRDSTGFTPYMKMKEEENISRESFLLIFWFYVADNFTRWLHLLFLEWAC